MAIPRVPEQELVMESADSVKAFDEAGEPGGPLFPIYHFNATALSQLVPVGANVLDLFCGSAQFLQYLLRGRDDLCGIGLDLSQGMLELAQKNVASAGLADRIQFVHADAVTADRAIKEPVAAVTCLSALHHCPTIEDLLTVLRSVRQLQEQHGCAVWLFDLVRPEKDDLPELIPRMHEISIGKSLDPAFKSDWTTSLRAGWTFDEFRRALDDSNLPLRSVTANYSQLHWTPAKNAVEDVPDWNGATPDARDRNLATNLAKSLEWHHLTV